MSKSPTDHPLYLGFLEQAPSWSLESRFFKSKVGGHPAWLRLRDLPSPQDLECPRPECKEPMTFLLQVYAPSDEAHAFHRTLSVFMCRHPQCHNTEGITPFKVFRCQLPRRNEFYPYEDPEESEEWRPDLTARSFTKLCRLCGCSGSKDCSSCKRVSYCCKEHQVLDWKAGHKSECKLNTTQPLGRTKSKAVLPEFELISEEPEEEDLDQDSDDDEGEEESGQSETRTALAPTGTLNKEQVEDYVDSRENPEDGVFQKFKRIISNSPEQVIRYQRHGEPLLLSKNDEKSLGLVPRCPLCSAERSYEFQIMPQLLNKLNLDNLELSIDWGVLMVFTCTQSCNREPHYKSEVILRQNP